MVSVPEGSGTLALSTVRREGIEAGVDREVVTVAVEEGMVRQSMKMSECTCLWVVAL